MVYAAEMAEARAGLSGGVDAAVDRGRVELQQDAVFAVRHAGRINAWQDSRTDFHAYTSVL